MWLINVLACSTVVHSCIFSLKQGRQLSLHLDISVLSQLCDAYYEGPKKDESGKDLA